MSKKIFFWLDSELLSFSLSYFLKKMYDSELYAIVDITNKSKQFFIDQNLVKFEKLWFYFDEISPNDHVDIDFLKKFERKYDINLWNLAINERFFYKFNQYHKFSETEILSILEQECKLYEKILDETKPDYLFTKETIQHKDHLFYELCKKKGIKILTFHESLLGFRSAISQDAHVFDFNNDLENVKHSHNSFDEIQKFLESFNKSQQVNNYADTYQSSSIQRIKAAISFFFSKNSNTKTHFTYYGRSKLKVLFNELKTILLKKYRQNFIDKNLLFKFDKNEKFVYLPLSIDQERSLLLAAPYFTNQTEIIRHIAKSLPVDYKILVKEHPHQVFRNWRSIETYKEIMNIPNVFLIHPSVNAKHLYKYTSLVITVGGTSGFDAAIHGKPTIIFSNYGYKILPSVTKVENIEKLPEAILNSLNQPVDPKDVSKYVNLLMSNSFDFDRFKFWIDEYNHFFMNGYLADVEISVKQMEIFLEKNKKDLENLVTQHIKKIEQLEQM